MAGNKELIDEIVDPRAVKQVTDLDAKIKQLEATFASAAKQALAFSSAAGGSTTNSAFVKNVNESNKAVKNLIDTREKLTTTIISNSQAEVDAYNKSKNGQEGVISTINKRRKVEMDAANEATARNAKVLKQQEKQATEYIRAQGLIEAAKTRLERYKILADGATNPAQLEKYNKKIQDTQNVIKQLGNAGKEGFDSLGNAIVKSGNLFSGIGQKIVTLARILPGIGVVGLIAFATDPIIDYIKALDLFKSKVSSAAETQKALNEVYKESNKDAATQITSLKYIYAAATDVNNSMHDRLQAARELQRQYPITFGLQSQENIINGEASGIYKQLTLDIVANARAKAAAAKIDEETAKILDAQVQAQKIAVGGANRNAQIKKDLETRVRDALSYEFKRRGIATSGANFDKAVQTELERQFVTNNKLNEKKIAEQANIIKQAENNIRAVENLVGGPTKLGNSLVDPNGKNEAKDAKKAEADAKRRAKELAKAVEEAEKEAYKMQLENERIALDARTRLLEDYFENEKKLEKSAEDDVAESNNARLSNIEEYASKELDALVKLYQNKEITEQEFNDRRETLEKNAALQSIDSAITLAEDLIEIQKSYGLNTQAEEDRLAKLRLSRSKLVRDGILDDLKKEAEARKNLKDLTKQVVKEAEDFVVTLVDAGFENRKNKIQEEINLVDENSKAEIDAVNRSLLSNTDKAAKVQLIEAQADAQKKQLQRQQKEADIDKAKFDKAVSLARIVQATAEAEISALSYLSNPLTAPLYPGIAGLIAALGAIQLATVLATPIPAYEKGTKNAKGGTSLVGEKGPEYVITPQGATFLTPGKPTLMDIPKGSTVIPHLQTARMMDVQKYAGGQAVDMSEVVRAIERNKPVKGKTVINGWLQESKASAANQKRRNEYFN